MSMNVPRLWRAMRLPSVCLVLLGLAGCISSDVQPPSLETRQTLKLTGATVDFIPDAEIHISIVEDEVNFKGNATKEQVTQAERAQISQVLPEEFMKAVGPKLSGSRPVVAHIHVKAFVIPGPVQALLVGGGMGLVAGVDLVDAKSGEVLNAIPPGKIDSSVYRPGGMIGAVVQVVESGSSSEKKTRELSLAFSSEYARWIAPNSQ